MHSCVVPESVWGAQSVFSNFHALHLRGGGAQSVSLKFHALHLRGAGRGASDPLRVAVCLVCMLHTRGGGTCGSNCLCVSGWVLCVQIDVADCTRRATAP